MKAYYDDGTVTIYHGDCRDVSVFAEVLVTDPPYIGREDLFATDGVVRLLDILLAAMPGLVFWPCTVDVPGTPSAVHVWHKSVPIHPGSVVGNVAGHHYERILDYGLSRKCEVFRMPAVMPGFAACAAECVDHPTQKPLALMLMLLSKKARKGIILDPYMGSGTTLVAAKRLGRKAIGIEVEERYCEIAARRLAQGSLFVAGDDVLPSGGVQESLL